MMYPEKIDICTPVPTTENVPPIGELIMKAAQVAIGIECDLGSINSRITGANNQDNVSKRAEPSCLRDEAFALLDILESIAKITNNIGRAL